MSSLSEGLHLVRGVVLIPIITKLLGTASFGVWSSLLGLAHVLAGIGGFRLTDSLIKFYPQESQDGETFVDILVLGTFSAFGVSGSFFVITTLFDVLPSIDSPGIIIPVSLLIGLFILRSILTNYLRARGQIKLFETLNQATILTEIIVLVSTFFVFQSVTAGFWALASVSALVVIGLLGYFLPQNIGRPRLRRFPKYLRFSVPLIPKTLAERLVLDADKYIVLYLLSPTAAGVYAICGAMGRLIWNLFTPLNPSLYPLVMSTWQDDRDSLETLYKHIFRGFTVIGLPAVAGLSYLAYPLLATLSTTNAASMGQSLLPLLAFGFLLYSFSGPIEFILSAADRTLLMAKIAILITIVNLILNFALVPVFGLYGAAAATITAFGLLAVLMVYTASQEISLDFSLLSGVRSGVATGGMLLVLASFPVRLDMYATLVLFPPIGVLVYFTLLLVTGEITQGDLHKLLDLIYDS